MSRNLTPVNQVRLTNVATVRYKKAGFRFELACYPNKVLGWRNKTEKDIDEVLQTHTIFSNVSKGSVAKRSEIAEAFGADKAEDEVVLEILTKGELQVGKQEREQAQESTLREIATIVADKCIDPETKRPYTVAQIERAMKDIHFSVKPSQNPKMQALDVIRQLKESIPIERAKMRLRLVLPKKDAKRIRDLIAPKIQPESETWDDDGLEVVCCVDPGDFRGVDDVVRTEARGKGMLEILTVQLAGDDM